MGPILYLVVSMLRSQEAEIGFFKKYFFAQQLIQQIRVLAPGYLMSGA